jgi:hypothetical protein
VRKHRLEPGFVVIQPVQQRLRVFEPASAVCGGFHIVHVRQIVLDIVLCFQQQRIRVTGPGTV